MRTRTYASAILLGAALLCAPVSVFSQQDNGPRQDMRNAGHETKNAAHDAGRGTKQGTKKAYHATKNGTKKAGRKTRNTTQGAANGGRQGARQPQ